MYYFSHPVSFDSVDPLEWQYLGAWRWCLFPSYHMLLNETEFLLLSDFPFVPISALLHKFTSWWFEVFSLHVFLSWLGSRFLLNLIYCQIGKHIA